MIRPDAVHAAANARPAWWPPTPPRTGTAPTATAAIRSSLARARSETAGRSRSSSSSTAVTYSCSNSEMQVAIWSLRRTVHRISSCGTPAISITGRRPSVGGARHGRQPKWHGLYLDARPDAPSCGCLGRWVVDREPELIADISPGWPLQEWLTEIADALEQGRCLVELDGRRDEENWPALTVCGGLTWVDGPWAGARASRRPDPFERSSLTLGVRQDPVSCWTPGRTYGLGTVQVTDALEASQ